MANLGGSFSKNFPLSTKASEHNQFRQFLQNATTARNIGLHEDEMD